MVGRSRVQEVEVDEDNGDVSTAITSCGSTGHRIVFIYIILLSLV